MSLPHYDFYEVTTKIGDNWTTTPYADDEAHQAEAHYEQAKALPEVEVVSLAGKNQGVVLKEKAKGMDEWGELV